MRILELATARDQIKARILPLSDDTISVDLRNRVRTACVNSRRNRPASQKYDGFVYKSGKHLFFDLFGFYDNQRKNEYMNIQIHRALLGGIEDGVFSEKELIRAINRSGLITSYNGAKRVIDEGCFASTREFVLNYLEKHGIQVKF